MSQREMGRGRGIRIHGWLVSLATSAGFLLTPVCAVSAQAAYKAAHGHSSIVPRKYGFFTANFAEAGVGLTFVGEWGTWCDYGECDHGGTGFTGYLAAGARKEETDLFASMDFAPGIEAGGTVYRAFGQDGARYSLVYVTLGYANVKLRLAERSETLLSFDERYQHDLLASVGFNHMFGLGTAVGARVEGRRELGSLGVARKTEICVPARFPLSTVTYRSCSDRYLRNTFEPLPDIWTGHLRSDLTLGIATFGESESLPTLAIVAAASLDFVENRNTSANFGLGAALLAAGYPGMSWVTLMAGANDAFDANGIAPHSSDRFVASLTVGIPFTLVMR